MSAIQLFLRYMSCYCTKVLNLKRPYSLSPLVNCWLSYSVTLEVTCKKCSSPPVGLSCSLDTGSCIHAVTRLEKSWLHRVGIFIRWYVTLLMKHINVKPLFNSFILKPKILSLEELCTAPSACAPAFHVLV